MRLSGAGPPALRGTVAYRADLARLASEAGVDPGRAAEVADGEEFATEVRAEQELAGMLGITAVPTFVFDRSTALSGAQPVELMSRAIGQAISPAS